MALPFIAIAAIVAGATAAVLSTEEGIRWGVQSSNSSNEKANFKNRIKQELANRGYADSSVYEYIDTMSDDQLINTAVSGGYVDTRTNLLQKIFGGKTMHRIEDSDITSIAEDLIGAENMYKNAPEMPSYDDVFNDILNGKDATVNAYLDELLASEARSTDLFENQLQENNMAFNDYRSQLLGNQYRQNSQLLGAVGSEMDRARRNALEAGASAGLRMAENINTTLALQNKQAQTSLETSNQLAQQLLNQRQASMGIRSNYNQMLSDNSAERRRYIQDSAQRTYDRKMYEYDIKKDEYNTDLANSTNPYVQPYSNWKNDKAKSQYN